MCVSKARKDGITRTHKKALKDQRFISDQAASATWSVILIL